MLVKTAKARMGRAAMLAVSGSGVLLALGSVAAPVAQAQPPGMCVPGMPCGPGGPGGPGGFGMGGPAGNGPMGFGPGGPGGPGPAAPGFGGPGLGPVGSFLSDLCILPIVCPPPR
ncbi:hypothetical protein BayCH28_15985 [Mycolicibacterium sp. CH28]|nr:hypothetical protein BayCH28_15985 [Mycolicibacterium sp. CH28]